MFYGKSFWKDFKVKKHSIKLFAAYFLISISNSCFSDDSEIFFSKDTSQTKPNIVFLLDISGSMLSELDGKKTRLDVLVESFEEIISDPSVANLRVGVMSFDSYTEKVQEVIDIDLIDSSKDIVKTTSGEETTLQQRIIISRDDAREPTAENYEKLEFKDTSVALKTGNVIRTLGFRFDNILLKKPQTVGMTSTDRGIKQATLTLSTSTNDERDIYVFTDSGDDVPYFKNHFKYLSSRAIGNNIICKSPSNQKTFNCDVTEIIRNKINQPNWRDGNAIAFYIKAVSDSATIYLRDYSDSNYHPKLTIKANNLMVAENRMTYREDIITKSANLITAGNTSIVQGMYDVARYITNMQKSGSAGPSHDNQWGKSPLLEGCQLTHMVIMTDGEATGGYSGTVGPYIGQSSNSCKILTDSEGSTIAEPSSTSTAEKCGRALASWLAKTSQSSFEGGNYVRTQTIGFAIKNGSNAQRFVDDIAKWGMGKSYNASNASELTQAFKEIVNGALVIDSPSTSGRVTLSPQSPYKQRNEVYYALYKSENYNYWPGNVKGFFIDYVDTTLIDGSTGQRAILFDKDGKSAMGADGVIKDNVSSFWSNSILDGGKVDVGGVLGMLNNAPNFRNVFTIINNDKEELKADANLTNTDLGITGENQDNVRKGLLNYIRGYVYAEGGSTEVATKKMGDSARSGITLASYGCKGDSEEQDILNCKFSDLSQVALLASNDGFLRGYDVTNGETLYEYMPKEMLPIIQGLQARDTVSIERSRFYGLDGNVILYHDDKDNDGYIDSAEDAFAYVVSGRGGSYLYAIDIKDKTEPKLAWMISNKTAGFDKLGNTWSVPITGKIKVGDVITPVLIFGGGYDTSNDRVSVRHTDDVGDALYIVNAKTGDIIWSTTSNMDYSIPSSIATLRDDSEDELITDIFFGDMGGQLWRFSVNNGAVGNSLIKPGGGQQGIVAKLADDSLQQSRRFYQPPVVYKFMDEDNEEVISVSMGSGYRAHPLSTDITDRIYSFRFPIQTDLANTKVMTETDLAVTTEDGQSLNEADKLDNGFVIKLGAVGNASGEKVISDAFADFDRIVFNTYIPTKTVTKNCVPGTGTQRTYNFDLKTGTSLLDTAFIETSVSALPPDVATYCNGSYCTIISDSSQLSDENSLPQGKDKDAFIVKTGEGKWVKTGWTDYFSLEI